MNDTYNLNNLRKQYQEVWTREFNRRINDGVSEEAARSLADDHIMDLQYDYENENY